MNTIIKGEVKGTIEEKRFYIPGVTIEHLCSKCSHKRTVDLGSEYFGYPTVNEPFSHTVYCYECGNEDEITLKINLGIEVQETNS